MCIVCLPVCVHTRVYGCVCVCTQCLTQLLVAEDCVTVHRTVQQMDTSNFFSKPAVQISSTGKHLISHGAQEMYVFLVHLSDMSVCICVGVVEWCAHFMLSFSLQRMSLTTCLTLSQL